MKTPPFPSLKRKFKRTAFPVSVLQDFIDAFDGAAEAAMIADGASEPVYRRSHLSVNRGIETWSLVTVDEWLAEYGRDESTSADLGLTVGYCELRIGWFGGTSGGALGRLSAETDVTVSMHERHMVEKIMNVLRAREQDYRLPEPPPVPKPELPPPPPVRVFVGHGRAPDWRDLQDHLRDKHGYDVVSYEIGARAGHTIRDILTSMLNRSTMAFLVMTGDDQTADGTLRARQNVIHEIGLFQGRLGFDRAIAVVEQDVELFTNLDGIQQLRYPRGNIANVFGDAVAVINREFPMVR